MDLLAKQQVAEQQLQQAEQQARLWTGRVVEFRARVAQLTELIAEEKEQAEADPPAASPAIELS